MLYAIRTNPNVVVVVEVATYRVQMSVLGR